MIKEHTFLFIGGKGMTRIPEKDRDIIEQAIYLPMVLTVLHRDLTIIQSSPFKLKNPYVIWIEQTIKIVNSEYTEAKKYLRQENIKVNELQRDEDFTMFLFVYKGYEERHSYFNPRIRNKVEELMKYFLYERFKK